MILPIYQGGFFGAKNADIKLFIVDTSLSNYMPKYIKPMRNINNITCVWETCISAMLIQLYLKKEMLSQLSKLDKLYIHFASNIYICKDINMISLNKSIEYFQTIHIQI